MSKTISKILVAALVAVLAAFAVAGCSNATAAVTMTSHDGEISATLANSKANSSFSTVELKPNQQLAMEYNITAGKATVEVEESNSASVLSDYPDLTGEGTKTITAPAGTVKVRVRGYDNASGSVKLKVEYKAGPDATGTFPYDTSKGDSWEAKSSDEEIVAVELEPEAADAAAGGDSENTVKTAKYTLKPGKAGKATVSMTHKQPNKKDEVAKYTVEVNDAGKLSITAYDGPDANESTFSVSAEPDAEAEPAAAE